MNPEALSTPLNFNSKCANDLWRLLKIPFALGPSFVRKQESSLFWSLAFAGKTEPTKFPPLGISPPFFKRGRGKIFSQRGLNRWKK
jgi:hypothetical protein